MQEKIWESIKFDLFDSELPSDEEAREYGADLSDTPRPSKGYIEKMKKIANADFYELIDIKRLDPSKLDELPNALNLSEANFDLFKLVIAKACQINSRWSARRAAVLCLNMLSAPAETGKHHRVGFDGKYK